MFCFHPLKSSFALFVLVLSAACSTPPTVVSKNSQPSSAQSSQGDLRFKTPDGWMSETPSSSMRVAQYRLPPAEGDSEAASLVVYYFGPGQGGSVEANLDRWTGQIQQADGSSSKGKARTETMTVNGMKTTLLDVGGSYAGGGMAGDSSGPNKPNFRMRAGVVETPKGAYFVKLVGPEKTVGKWDESFIAFVRSAEFKG
jgi:hypothetical protein